MTRWRDWVHVSCSTRGVWLPGDPRGFRDHDHRVHSSGDYKARPPRGEHAGLFRYSKQISRGTVRFEWSHRDRVASALVQKLDEMEMSWRVLAVGPTHVHALIKCDWKAAKRTFGRAKQFASHAVRHELPGTIWGEGSLPVQITGEAHYRAVVNYICDHVHEGAVVMQHPSTASNPERASE